MERILTVEQASDLLQLKAETLRTYLRKGIVPGRKIGKAWRISEEALRLWLQSATPPDRGQPVQTESERLALIDQLQGVFAHVSFSSEDLIRERREEAAREP